MQNCEQTAGQSILDHGLAVWKQLQKLTSGDTSDMRLPQWYKAYKDQILSSLHPLHILEQYTVLHDCGKPYCLQFDENGRRHFPNHAEISRQTYEKHYGTEGDHAIIAELIGLDMICHTESADDILKRNLSDATLCSLLLTALAEIHANAQMFGGIESTSFKIKFKKLEKTGNRICKRLFDHAYMYAITRKDLSIPQQAVQAGHAAIEASRAYLSKDDEHPSLILCIVKNEAKLEKAARDLEQAGIRIQRFYEPDRGHELTAIATEPLTGEARQHLRKFQLMK
jgi:hypothetical protein